MTTIEERFMRIPILNWVFRLLKTIKLPGFNGMNIYDLLRMYVIGIIKGALTARAGSIAFSIFLALFPFALFVLTIIPFIPIDNFQVDFILFIKQALPPKTSDAVDLVLFDIANNKYQGLLSFGFFMSIFLMANGMSALFSAFEYTYHNIKTRSIIGQYFVALYVSLLFVFALIVIASFLVFSNYFINELALKGFLSHAVFWNKSIQIVVILLTLFVSIATLYFYGTLHGKKNHFFSPGAIMSTILVLLNFKLFSVYVSKFSQYNQLYGSIGTLIVLMLFIWLNAIILLLGYELNTSISCLRDRSDQEHGAC
ncbi:MAG: ribonuclease BN [Flavobacteriales bacterium CG_4_8_14_3_um_filter_35_10]|nr:YihY/virulence factor BrkB family protein [Zetaproteobacteria bacterium]NDK18025.1 YihY/virulence factor BrkB family protein [Flavobacteriales bacterium]OIO09052.1 MAG: ribonuclease BN [Flavobacteriaceae bacterium CG1_02_35_72]PIR14727.1 MAG: ribonuclease BN [Flavobacteriales bacterium CG11_big_fil_rev_8_21_14_0_20_35_7]PIX05857.1 MAG: ribonuclease BN [Flavobacteriales bacterium CG_4_8_14_3_um_filter_35_10]PJA05831.1 MAG: ribonuclease BN [Flavobacteriales bacterium CG_4_10_14_0_2_um_filter_